MTNSFKTIHVVTRFALRLLVICAFAAFGNLGFGRSVAALLLLSAAVCAVTGILRRERPSSGTLTNWDEAAVYGLLFALTVTIDGALSS